MFRSGWINGTGINFLPIKPASLHLNEKVERIQRTVLDEFYSTVDIKDHDIPICYYNGNFIIIGLDPKVFKGRTQIQGINALSNKTPLWES